MKTLLNWFLLSLVLAPTTMHSQEDISGCTYELACNYDPLATIHEDVCDFETCAGCTFPDAINYDITASLENGSCEGFDSFFYTADLNSDGLVDTTDLLIFLFQFGIVCLDLNQECELTEASTDNCTSSYACNYNPEAVIDDGSCTFDECQGCTYLYADNYDPCAIVDNGTCVWVLISCPGDCNHDFKIDTVDLLCLLSQLGQLI